MTARLRPASPLRLPALSHLMASAFAPGPAAALIATPAAMVSLLPSVLRRGLWETADRDGMVVFARYRPVLDAVLAVAVVALGFAAGIAVLVAAGAVWGVAGVLVVLLLMLLLFGVVALGGVLLLAASLSSFSTAVGRETPSGRRWTVMALAQRPGTRLSALLLTRRLIAGHPAGSVVVAVAASPELAGGYERLGFTRGRGARVHLQT
ncbi:MAG: hypothetical protein Q7T71_04045 [Herbiconiux sp.]|nr:hypothetical protein [Herbiconiux sp.]